MNKHRRRWGAFHLNKSTMINDLGLLANQLLKIRDALVIEDYEEAYHQLYLIADPETEKLDPWAEIEDLAEEHGETGVTRSLSFDWTCKIEGYEIALKEEKESFLGTILSASPSKVVKKVFKIQAALSFEEINYATDEEIGRKVKLILHKLKSRVEDFEKRGV
jgi:hypothetical protein